MQGGGLRIDRRESSQINPKPANPPIPLKTKGFPLKSTQVVDSSMLMVELPRSYECMSAD